MKAGPETKSIPIGCGEWGFRALPMRDHFEITKKFGMRWLEFGIGGGQTGRLSEDPTGEEISGFLALADEFDMKCPFCCIENDFTLPDASAHDSMVEKVIRQIDAAARCKATHVRLFAGFTAAANMTDSIWKRMLHAFSQCQDLCSELGLTIAIETHGAIAFNDEDAAIHTNSITTDRDGLARLLAELPPEVGFNFDPGNIKAVDPDDRRLALDLINDRVNYCHLKDWTRKGEGWVAVAIGDDDLDYAPIFREMKFDGVCLIEYEPLHDTEAGIRRSLDYLERLQNDHHGLKFTR